MEGIGSRLGRVSSRYGSSPGPLTLCSAVQSENGRDSGVRSQPTNSVTTAKAKHHHHHHHQKAPPLLLCRWTPLNSDYSSKPKRRFRYTPVFVLEEKKKEPIRKFGDEAKTKQVNQSAESGTVRSDMHFTKPYVSDLFIDEFKHYNVSRNHTSTEVFVSEDGSDEANIYRQSDSVIFVVFNS